MKPIKNLIELSGIKQLNWLNPLFLAIFPAIIIIYLQPIKFIPLIIEEYSVLDNFAQWFDDLEGDGKAERIRYGNEASEGHAHIIYYNDKAQYIGQYNLKHPVPKTRTIQKPYAADFNRDGVKDIVLFTQHNDSLFLNAFDYKNENGLLNNRFITTIGGYNEHRDYQINHIGHFDANNDSIPEYYFSVASGFAWYPRRVFRYDFKNDTLIASINTGAGHLDGRIFEHNDSVMISVGSISHGNIKENYPYPYHDTTTWFFGFDKDLKLLFAPKNYGLAPSGIELPMFKDGFIYYLYASNNELPENKLFKMTWNGEVIDSIALDFYVTKRFFKIKSKNKDNYYIFNAGAGEYSRFNIEQFKIEKKRWKLKGRGTILGQCDLTNDGEAEVLVFNPMTKQIDLYNSKFKKQYTLFLNINPRNISSNFYKEEGYGQLIINSNKQTKTFQYYNNPNQYYKYPLWLGIYLLSVLFMAFVLFLQNKRTQQQQKMEQQLADLQLQNLRNQLDPHFTFNVLNSVGNAIYNQDKEAAYDLFQRFTRIVRSSLMSSDKVFRSLKEELQFTRDYLEFQKIRFPDRFDYSIEVDNNVAFQHQRFPKMLIQGYAENAVKHAFFETEHKGQISIKVCEKKKHLQVILQDDGIGINKSKEQKSTSGTQKGLIILAEQVKQINRIYKTAYTVLIEDKTELDTNGNGTRITISLKR